MAELRKMVSFKFTPSFLQRLDDLKQLLAENESVQWPWRPSLTRTRAIELAVNRTLDSFAAAKSDNVSSPAKRIDVSTAAKKSKPKASKAKKTSKKHRG